MSQIIPIPKFPITVRPATMEDLSFIDGLQKMHTRQVGWMPEKALVGKIKLGHVLVAVDECNERVGYLIGNDQYFKRDDVGIIYQINIAEGKRRALVGATLLKAQFDRSAYGCKLYCCWCAQDIEANYFWESLGFIPLAFRAGSRDKGRVHIFWQRRIRAGDCETPYWFPSQTTSGSIREDRLVLPIPPGTHWSDAKPLILPGGENEKALPAPRPKREKIAVPRPGKLGCGFLGFVVNKKSPAEKPKREKRVKQKNDPKYVAAARELRDRWLERVNDDPSVLTSQGKYEVSKALAAPAMKGLKTIPALPESDSTDSTSSRQARSPRAIAA